jgi:hypothetical protein
MTGWTESRGGLMADSDPRIRFRVWVSAELVDETWLDVGNPDVQLHMVALRNRHLLITEEADRQDRPWLIEWWDPDEDRYGRFGTDAAGMIDPPADEGPGHLICT